MVITIPSLVIEIPSWMIWCLLASVPLLMTVVALSKCVHSVRQARSFGIRPYGVIYYHVFPVLFVWSVFINILLWIA